MDRTLRAIHGKGFVAMNVVLHSPLLDDTRAKVLKAIMLADPSLTVEALPEVQDLASRLLNPEAAIGLLFIRVVDRHHLKQLFHVRELLRQVRVAVLVPDLHHDTIALAHALHPRLMLCGESGLHELTAVVDRLIDIENNPGGQNLRTRRQVGAKMNSEGT